MQLGLLLASLGLATQVRAEESTFALSWVRLDGAESCPGRGQLAREVSQRLGRDPFSSAAERSLEVVASRSDGRWLVRIHVRDADGATLGFRTLDSRDDDCTAIFSATALALALTADPELVVQAATTPANESLPAATNEAREPSPPRPVPAAPAPPESPPPAANLDERRLPSEAPVVRQVVVVERPAAAREPERVPARPQSGQTLSLGGGPLVAFGLVPGTGLGGMLGGAWRHPTGFALQIGARFLKSNRTAASAKPADFGVGLSAGSLGAAFVPVDDAVRFSLGAGVLLGAQHVSVHAPTPTPDGPGDYFWAAARTGAQFAVALAQLVRLGLFADLVVPLTRHRFFLLDEEEPAYESGRLGGMAGAYVEITSE